MTDALDAGRAPSEALDPGMEAAPEARCGALLPGMAEAVVELARGRRHARPGLPPRGRMIAAVTALAAQGATTRPQLKVNVAAGRRAGLAREEIAELIWQMALRGGLPAPIDGFYAAMEVFAEEDAAAAGTRP